MGFTLHIARCITYAIHSMLNLCFRWSAIFSFRCLSLESRLQIFCCFAFRPAYTAKLLTSWMLYLFIFAVVVGFSLSDPTLVTNVFLSSISQTLPHTPHFSLYAQLQPGMQMTNTRTPRHACVYVCWQVCAFVWRHFLLACAFNWFSSLYTEKYIFCYFMV